MTENQNLIDNVRFGEDVLSMEHITKIYNNGFVANNDISFHVKKGEILGLVGENGAGKTTLMKVLFGLEIPEEGKIFIGGKEVIIPNPLVALDYGIGMVHQHFMLVETLTVAENMVLGAEPGKGLFFDPKAAVRRTNEISKKYGLEVNPKAIIRDLSVGYKQRVEILKILLRGAKILLLDEPTAVLTPQETKELFAQLKKLKEDGFSIVFISHKLNEIKEICDRITVLRLGKTIGTVNVEDVSEADISRMMVGRDVFLSLEKEKARPKETVLSVRNLSHINKYGIPSFTDISFDIRSGEILGVAGVEGNGQTELSDTLSGLIPIQAGSVTVCGESLSGKSIRQIRGLGVSLVHEDRMKFGVSNNQTILENIISTRYYKKEYNRGTLLKLKYITAYTKKLIEDFLIKCDGPNSIVKTLSGGNIQKVVAAREFSSDPKLLIACHPTRGIDVGAAEMIHKEIIALRDKENTATLLFSADLNELLNLSDSIIVMHNGRIVAYCPDVATLSENLLGEYMLGVKEQSADEIGGVVFD